MSFKIKIWDKFELENIKSRIKTIFLVSKSKEEAIKLLEQWRFSVLFHTKDKMLLLMLDCFDSDIILMVDLVAQEVRIFYFIDSVNI